MTQEYQVPEKVRVAEISEIINPEGKVVWRPGQEQHSNSLYDILLKIGIETIKYSPLIVGMYQGREQALAEEFNLTQILLLAGTIISRSVLHGFTYVNRKKSELENSRLRVELALQSNDPSILSADILDDIKTVVRGEIPENKLFQTGVFYGFELGVITHFFGYIIGDFLFDNPR